MMYCSTMSEAKVFTAVLNSHSQRHGDKPALIERGENNMFSCQTVTYWRFLTIPWRLKVVSSNHTT